MQKWIQIVALSFHTHRKYLICYNIETRFSIFEKKGCEDKACINIQSGKQTLTSFCPNKFYPAKNLLCYLFVSRWKVRMLVESPNPIFE